VNLKSLPSFESMVRNNRRKGVQEGLFGGGVHPEKKEISVVKRQSSQRSLAT